MNDEKRPYQMQLKIVDFAPFNIFGDFEDDGGWHEYGTGHYRRSSMKQEHSIEMELSWEELGQFKN